MNKYFKYFSTITLLIISCSTANFDQVPPNKILSEKQITLRQIKQNIYQKNYQKALSQSQDYIDNYPSDLTGYEKLAELLNVTNETKEKILNIKNKFIENIPEEKSNSSLKMQINYIFLSGVDSVSAANVEDSLRKNFPNSDIINSIAQNKIFSIIIERNDSLRTKMLEDFLQKYAKTKWAPLGWKYLLYSYEETKMTTKLDSLLSDLENKKFVSNKMKDLVISYRIKQNKNLSEYKKIMNKIITNVHAADKQIYFDFLQNKTKEEVLQKYYYTLVKILEKENNFAEIIQVLEHFDNSDLDSKLLFCKGKTFWQLKKEEMAFSTLLECAKKGDRKSNWSSKADSLLKDIYKNLTTSDENFIEFCCVWDNYKGSKFVDYTNNAGLSNIKAGRVAWGDYNNDGYEDILFDGKRLFKNTGKSTFVEVTEEVGIAKNLTTGGVWADFNRDGWLDFFAASSSSSKEDKLMKNIEGKKFLDITDATPVADTLQTEGAAWGDINGDLLPDLYLANYQRWQVLEDEPDFLFLNLGNGKFKDVTREMNIIPPFGQNQAGRGVNWGDYNNDGFLDIFVSNYRLDKNFLWQNKAGDDFQNVAFSKGVEGNYVDGWFGHTIGSDWGDFDNDGDLDLLTANLAHPRYIEFSDKTMLYENIKAGKIFSDIRVRAGITYDECHSDPTWFDANGDGYLDLYITSIYSDRRSYLYQNNGDKTFADITYLSNTGVTNGWGAAASDFDNDGDLDLLVCSGEGIHLFKNETKINHWLKVKVVDINNFTSPIGSRVYANQKDISQMREISGGKGTTNQNSMTQYFAFPDYGKVKLKIIFPDGLEKTKTVEQLNKTVLIKH